MNERIRELLEQAGVKFVVMPKDTEYERFAELIIEECAMVIEKNLFQGIGWNTSRAVKRHFGIGEEE
jgi:hypothetical protein